MRPLTDEVSIHVDAPAEQVWALVSDVTRIGEFSPETVAGRWTGGSTGPEVGATFAGQVKRNGVGPTYWSACRVTRCEPEREFEFSVGTRKVAVNNWGYRLRPSGEGTEVTEYYRLEPMLPMRLYWAVLGRARGRTNARGMRTTLERMKAVLEGSTPEAGAGLTGAMSTEEQQHQVVSATREIEAPPEVVFELIADPARQPEWDGNDNLAAIVGGGRISAVGDVFTMRLTNDKVRDNHVVDVEEGRRLAWRPASEGQAPAGHEWRWEIEPLGEGRSRVTHTYDWRELTDESRMAKARSMTPEHLRASLDRLAEVAESANG
ncbi:SRPBCC family protein [Serinicoccus profundi]|uniref:SRPBCC family protein n=1 Tax=Serinicoccus profundi TaxID=1078471 RepID=UPI000255E7B9